MTFWSSKIFQSKLYTPLLGSILDCLLECFILDVQSCDFFVFDNNTCYEGRLIYNSGSVQENYYSATVFYQRGQYLLKYFVHFLDLLYCPSMKQGRSKRVNYFRKCTVALLIFSKNNYLVYIQSRCLQHTCILL